MNVADGLIADRLIFLTDFVKNQKVRLFKIIFKKRNKNRSK